MNEGRGRGRVAQCRERRKGIEKKKGGRGGDGRGGGGGGGGGMLGKTCQCSSIETPNMFTLERREGGRECTSNKRMGRREKGKCM